MKDKFEKLKSPRQAALFKDWINSQINQPHIKNVQKGTVTELLERGDMPNHVRKVLKIRQALSKSSTAKYQTLLNKLCEDGTIKDCFMYHGSRTGRWAGRGFQPQNLPRAGFSAENADMLIGLLKESDLPISELEAVMGSSFFETASKLIRPMVCAPEGKELICSDYKQVEARGLAWLAGEKWKLEAFEEGQPLYELAATKIYGKKLEDITALERQAGKMLELACGYGGGHYAVAAMCKGYGVKSLTVDGLNWAVPALDDKIGLLLFKQGVEPLIARWRQENPASVGLWGKVETAMFQAVRNPGLFVTLPVGLKAKDNCPDGVNPYETVCHLEFIVHENFLTIRLPSQRQMFYYNPHIRMLKTPWGKIQPTICYWGVSSQKEKVIEGSPAWGCISTHGGKAVENIDQALCRDLLAEGMLGLEKNGYPVALHAHDEAAAVVYWSDGGEVQKHFDEILGELPSWAEGFPLAAEGWRGRRYRK